MSEMMSTANSSIKNSNKRKRVPDNTTHMFVPTTATVTTTTTTTKNRNYENNDNTNNDLCSIDDIITTKTQPVTTTTTTTTTPTISTANVKRTSIRQKYQRNCNIKPNAIHITTRKSSTLNAKLSTNLYNSNEENSGDTFDLDKKTNAGSFEELHVNKDDEFTKDNKDIGNDNVKRREIEHNFIKEDDEEGNEESTNDDDELSSNNSNSSKSNNSNNYIKYKLNLNTKQKHKRKKCAHPTEDSMENSDLEAHEENLEDQVVKNNYPNNELNDANEMNKNINWCDKRDEDLEVKDTEKNKDQQVNESFFELNAEYQQNVHTYDKQVNIIKTESYKNQQELSPAASLLSPSPPASSTTNLIDHFHIMVNNIY